MDTISTAVIDLAKRHFGTYKIRNGQVIPDLCPLCGGGAHKDRETFAIGMYNGAWNCARGSCQGVNGNREGNFKAICNYFGEAAFEFSQLPQTIKTAKKIYSKPDPNSLHPLTDEIITYMSTRGISESTLKDFHVSSDANGNMIFPFYRDGVLTYVKYRVPKKFEHVKKEYENKIAKLPPEEAAKIKKPSKEWQDANTEPILFGMDNVSFNKPLVITEGEIDALSVYEAGVHNVVSVPCGCKNLDWIQICWDWLDKFNQIIIFGDADEPGMDMVSNVMKRLGEDRCMIPGEYPELVYNDQHYNRPCKDANEILCCYGPDGLKTLIDACEPAPIKGALEVSSIQRKKDTFISLTKIPKLDEMLNGFIEGGVTILSGKRSAGKSTISSGFILNAIEQGVACCAYSGELSPTRFLDWILLPATENKYITYNTDPKTGKHICTISKEIEDRIKDWMKGKLYLFDDSVAFEEDTQTAVLKVFEMCARRYGCKLFLIDNLLSLLPSSDDEVKMQARVIKKIKAFAKKYRAHVLVVAHPRKEQANATFTSDSVSGSSAITDLADSVFSIERPNIRVTKNRTFGETGFVPCDYDPVNHRIYQKGLGDRIIYSWDHTGIKVPDPEDQACLLPEFQIQPGEENAPF